MTLPRRPLATGAASGRIMPSIRTLLAGDTGRQGRVPLKPLEPPGFESAMEEASESLFRIVRGGRTTTL